MTQREDQLIEQSKAIPPVILFFTTAKCATWPTDELDLLRRDTRLQRFLEFAGAAPDILRRRTSRPVQMTLERLLRSEDADLCRGVAELIRRHVVIPLRPRAMLLGTTGLNEGTIRMLEGGTWDEPAGASAPAAPDPATMSSPPPSACSPSPRQADELTMAEAEAAYGIPRSTLHKYASKAEGEVGHVPSRKLGRNRLFKRSDLSILQRSIRRRIRNDSRPPGLPPVIGSDEVE